jgi:bZIP transcription factor
MSSDNETTETTTIVKAEVSSTESMVSKTPAGTSPPPGDSVGDSESVDQSLSKKRKGDDDDLVEQRKSANRRSAFQSRLRKKLLIEELQGKVSDLTEQLDTLKEDNKSLCHRLESALAENRRLRFAQQQELLMARGTNGMGMQAMNHSMFNNAGAGLSTASISALLASKGNGAGGFDPSAMFY